MKPWSMNDLRILHTLAPTHARSQIAAVLGRTPGAVAEKARKLGIALAPAEKWTHPWEVVDAIREAHDAGAPPAELARRFPDVPKRTIHSYIYNWRRI